MVRFIPDVCGRSSSLINDWCVLIMCCSPGLWNVQDTSQGGMRILPRDYSVLLVCKMRTKTRSTDYLVSRIQAFITQSGVTGISRFVDRNKWFSYGGVKVYVRINSIHTCAGNALKCLDVASIDIIESRQGRGIFTDLIAKLHAINPYQATFVENVLEPRFQAWFPKHGWAVTVDGCVVPSYFMLREQSK